MRDDKLIERAEKAEAERDAALAEVERLRTVLTKISSIRDSIIGMQGFNFSEHAYPLVAALEEAGFEGEGYDVARVNLGTLIEQRDKALALLRQLSEEWFEPHYGQNDIGMAALLRDKLRAILKDQQRPLAEVARPIARKSVVERANAAYDELLAEYNAAAQSPAPSSASAALRAERDAALAEVERLRAALGELRHVLNDASLLSAGMEPHQVARRCQALIAEREAEVECALRLKAEAEKGP